MMGGSAREDAKVAGASDDPLIRACRAQIADLDREILEALNRRIRLVRELKAHKEGRGLAFRDPAQEGALLEALRRANSGPLPDEGVREVFGLILAWCRSGAEGGNGD